MFDLFNKNKKDDSSAISQNDLNLGFDFINFLLSKGINPLTLLGSNDLTNKYLEEYKKERVG